MIRIYYADCSVLYEESAFRSNCGLADPGRLEKVWAEHTPKGRARSLGAGLLLRRALEADPEWLAKYGSGSTPAVADAGCDYDHYGKPSLRRYPDIYFNLSHSGDYVLCGLSDKELGVDIQYMRGVSRPEEALLHRISAPEERAATEAAAQEREDCGPSDLRLFFYTLWTIKESYSKLTGRGLAQGMDSFYADGQGGIRESGSGRTLAWYRTAEALTDYPIACCAYGSPDISCIRRLTL